MQRVAAWLLGLAVITAAWWFAGHPGWQSEQQKRQHEPLAENSDGPKLYKWRDEHGVTQITQIAPKGRQYTVVNIREDQNVLESDAPAPEPPP